MASKDMTYFDPDFKIHTSYHNSFFILRTPIHINGLPVQIRDTGQGPVLSFTQSGVTISVKLWEISRLVGPVFYNHGVYHVDTFYHGQFPLFQVAFPSEASLKRFLLASEAVSSEVESALSEMFMQRAQSSEPGKALDSTPLSVQAEVDLFLVSPSHEKRKATNVHRITLTNFSVCTSLWKNSEVFEFGQVFATCISTAEEAEAPRIISHKQDSKNVIAEDRVTFSIQVTGTQPLSYCWEIKQPGKDWQHLSSGGNRIEGADAALLSVESVQKSDEGSYRCTVTNCAGSETSQPAQLTVVEPVELRDLLNVLQDVDDWFHFGIYLKVPVSRLREIKREYQTVTDRKITMLDEWSNQVVPTWAGVVQALVGMGRKALAIRIGTKYGAHVPESVSREPIQTILQSESGEHLVMNAVSVQKHKDHLMETEEKLMTTKGSLKAASAAEAVASEKRDEIKNSLSQLQGKLQQVTQEMTAIRREVESKKEENEALKELKDIYEAKSKKKAEKVHALQRVIDAKEEEIRGIRGELQAKEAESQSLLHEVDALKRELGDKSRELIAKIERVQELQREKDEFKGICNSERYQVEMLLQQVAAQRESHESYIKEAALSTMKEEIEARRTRQEEPLKDDLVEEIKTLSTKLEKQETEVAVLQKELDSQEAIPAETLMKKKEQLIRMEAEFLEMKIKLLQVEGRKKQIERLRRITFQEQRQMIEASTQLQSVLGEPPMFILHPESWEEVGPGVNVVFSCQATGTEPLTYCLKWKPLGQNEWKVLSNGVDRVHGADAATLTIASLQKSREGSYRCTVFNCVGRMESECGSLTMAVPPIIVIHPQYKEASPGERITFSIEATGTLPLSYYWELRTLGKDWQLLRDSGYIIQGVKTASLLITSVHEAHEGSYRCTTTNCAGIEISQPAQLAVVKLSGGQPKSTSDPQSEWRVTGWLKKAFFAKKNVPVLLVNGGHHDEVDELFCLLRKRKGEDVTAIPKIPPIGFYTERFDFMMDTTFTVFCLAYGRRPPSHLFTSTFQKIYAVVFIVTGNDREQISVAREELFQLLNEEKLRDAPLLILASKQDLPNAVSKEEVVDKLGLPSVQNRIWYIQATSIDGLYEGMHWLREQSKQRQHLHFNALLRMKY